jgi:uncharacterized protein YggE
MRFSVLLVSFWLGASLLQAQVPLGSIPYLGTNQIRTTGTATRLVSPDLAIAYFEFSTRGPTLGEAARSAAVISEAIRRAVAKAGIPADSILGRGSVAYPWDQSPQMEIKPNAEFRRYDTTYVFRDMVVVRMRDLRRVSLVLDAALAAGAQKLTSLQFSSSRAQQAGQEALADATRQARRNAEIMAESANGKVGRPLELTTEKSHSGDDFYDLQFTNIQTGGSRTTQGLIARPPDGDLRVSVYTRWELLPARDSVPGR